MSYASVTTSNISPHSPQPRPDPALLNTSPPKASGVADDLAKVGVVAETFKERPRTLTSEANKLSSEYTEEPHIVTPEAYSQPGKSSKSAHHISSKLSTPSDGDSENSLESNDLKGKDKENRFTPRNRNGNRRLREVKAEGAYLWRSTMDYLLRPELMGGCVGFVNLGLLAGLGRAFYTKPHLRRDTAFILQTVTAAAGLLFVEGYVAERHRQTPRGSKEHREKEGALILKKIQEVVLRPGVLGGFIGLFNASVIGTLGYLAYANWDRPHWNRSHLSNITVGLIALVSGERLLAEHYRK